MPDQAVGPTPFANPARSVRILLLEDSPTDAALIGRALVGAGFESEVRLATRRAEFIAALEDFAPDVILIDHHLPAYSGPEALAEATRRLPAVPKILVSGAVPEEVAIEALTLGAEDYVMKDRLVRLAPVVRAAITRAALLRHHRDRAHTMSERIQNLANVLPGMAYEVRVENEEATLVWVSSRSKELFGVESTELTGRCHRWLSRVHPDEHDAVRAHMCLANPREEDALEYRFRCADGSYRWVEAHVALGDGPDDEARLRGIVLDADECVRARQDAERLRQSLVARVRQADVPAEIGRMSVAGASVDEILDHAAERVSEVLRVRFSGVLLARLDAEAVSLVAGRGWAAGCVGWATIEAGEGSQAGFALRSATPVLVEDLATEKRFRPSPMLRDHGVVSGVCAPIGRLGAPLGVLGAHDASPRVFSKDDVDFIQAVANTLAEVIERDRSEQRLRESEERFATVFRSGPTGLGITRVSDQRLVEVNDAFTCLTGYERDEVIGRTSLELGLLDLDARARMASAVEEHGRVRNVEFDVRGKDGRKRHVAGSSEMITLQGERHIVTSFIDRTEQYETERALRRNEALLTEAQRNAGMACWRYVPGRPIEWSDHMYELLGLPVGTTPSYEAVLAVMHPEDRVAREHSSLRAAIESPDATDYRSEYRVVRPDGSIRTLRSLGEIRRDAEGTVTEAIGTTQDITDWRRLESDLRATEEHLKGAVAGGQVGLWDWHLDSRKVKYSDEWKRQIGYAPGELTDDFSEWQSRVHPDDIDGVLRVVEEYLASDDREYQAEFRFRHRDGSYRRILAKATDVRDATGRRVRMVGSHVDVTDLVQLQAQLLHAQKMESLGRLAGGVAHDFNNILAVIGSVVDLELTQLHEGAPVRGGLLQIRDAAKRAAGLTRQLLAFGRREVVHRDVLDLNAVLEGMRPMIEHLIHKKVALIMDLGAGPYRVWADAGQVEQIVMNLSANASDAMPDGGQLVIQTGEVHLDETFVQAHEGARVGPHAVLTVRDSGTGMDAATLARIFEPFFTTKPADKGTGLGLATVYGLVKQSAGSVWCVSEPGKGSAFKVYLPIAPPR